jgi:hypothetical protein
MKHTTYSHATYCNLPTYCSPGLKRFVGLKGLILCVQEVRDSVPRRVVREGGKVLVTLACSDGRRSPHIGVYSISKVLGRRTDSYFDHWQPGGSGIYAGIAVCFLRVWIQFNPDNGTVLDELAGTQWCNVAQTAMQLHE